MARTPETVHAPSQPAGTGNSAALRGGAAWLTPLRLAWRNTWRHRRRTILLLVVVAYATITTIFYWSFVDGYMESVVNAHARFIAAPVRVTRETWFTDPDPENALADLAFVPSLLELPSVRAATPRLDFPGLLSSPYSSEGVVARGVDPAAEPAVSRIPEKVTEGRWLQAPGEVVLGYRVAERLDARVGERVVLDTASLAGSRGLGLQVVGLVDAGIAGVDSSAVIVHLDDARSLTGVSTATTVAVDAPRGREAAVAKKAKAALPAGVRAYEVWDLIGPIKTDVIGARISAIPIGLLLAALAAMAVTSTVLVSVRERAREFGVVEALGLLPGSLGLMVTAESVIATALGYGVGLLVGYAVVWVFATNNLIGPLFAAAGEVWASAGLTEEFYAAVHPVYALYALATVVLAGVFAIFVPARWVLRLEPSAAMRGE